MTVQVNLVVLDHVNATTTHPGSGQRGSADGVSERNSMHDGKERVKESVGGHEDVRERLRAYAEFQPANLEPFF